MTWFLLTSFCRLIKIIINSENKINSTKSSCSEVFLVKDVLKICSKFQYIFFFFFLWVAASAVLNICSAQDSPHAVCLKQHIYCCVRFIIIFFTKENILVNTVYFDNHISQMLFSHILSFNWKCRILLESDNSDMVQFLFLFLSSIVLSQTERFSTEDWTTWEI